MADLSEWLAGHGLGDLASVFEANDIDLDIVSDLNNEDLRELGLTIGQRKKLQRAIRQRQSGVEQAPRQVKPGEIISAEKRQITIMFCDLVGSTKISQSLDPERMFELLGLYQRNAAEVIARYGGHVAQFLGDGVFVYFGYPEAHEDDCQRAIIAAFELIASTSALEAGLSEPLRVRIGIDTGPVVIGDLRMSLDGDIDAVAGETPNRAAKIQSLAQPDEIVIGDQLKALLGDFVTCEDLGLREVGSGLTPQHSWRVKGYSERYGRLGMNQHGVSAPLIGRAEQCGMLADAWRDCESGKGGVVLISGEPGIGKSRLMRHMLNITPKECRRGLTFFCSSYHQGTAFHPIADQLRRVAGISFRDGTEGRYEKAQELLKLAKGRGLPDRLLPLYEALIVGENAQTREMSPAERKSRTIRTLHSLVLGRASERPVVILCEDLQWCDPSTLETMDYLIRNTTDLPVLYVFSYRPEFKCPWENRENARVLKLRRLSNGDSIELIRGVASNKTLPAELEADLVDKTDGIPLFIEEITRNLLASGMLRETEDRFELADAMVEIDIPATLNEALMTRIDRMKDVREVALWASALGRRFTVDQLEAVAPFPREKIYKALGRLASSDLMRKSGTLRQELYEFRHALVREAAYNSMVASKKKRMHQAIIEGLTQLDPKMQECQPDQLYHHHLMAGNKLEAIEMANHAGDLIANRYKGPETRHHYLAAYEIAKDLPDTPENTRIKLRSIIKLATSASRRREIEEDYLRLDKAAELARAGDNLPRLVQAIYWQARLRFDQGNERAAIALCQEGVHLASGSDDLKIRSSPENLLAFLYCLRGYPAKGIALTEKNSKDMEILGDRREATVMTGIYAFALASGGFYARAEEVALRAIRMAEELKVGQAYSVATFAYATVLGWAGRMDEAGRAVERALQAADDCHNPFQRFVTHGWAGEALLNAAEDTGTREPVSLARGHLQSALSIAGRLKSDFHRSGFQALHAKAALMSGDMAEARETIEEALETAQRLEQEWGLSIAQRVRAEIELEAGDRISAEVLAGLEASIAFNDEGGLRPEQIRGLTLMGRCLDRNGDADRAEATRARTAELRDKLGKGIPTLAAE